LTKPIIFISHIHEEKEFVNELKHLIESTFKNPKGSLFEVYASSSKESLPFDGNWFNSIKEKLSSEHLAVFIPLCSPKSIHSNWVHFEIGAVWMKKKLGSSVAILPVLHSGMTDYKDLPYDFRSATCSFLNTCKDIESLFYQIAVSTNQVEIIPEDIDTFVEKICALEEKYTFGESFSKAISDLEDYIEDLGLLPLKLSTFKGIPRNTICPISFEKFPLNEIPNLKQKVKNINKLLPSCIEILDYDVNTGKNVTYNFLFQTYTIVFHPLFWEKYKPLIGT
jgi:hypothetical protein